MRNAVPLRRQNAWARDLSADRMNFFLYPPTARRRSTYRRLALDDASDMVAALNALYGCERDAVGVLDVEARKVLTNFEDLILASPEVVSERRGRTPSRPYFDVTLRADKKAYVDFLRRLMDRRLLGVASESLNLVTPFVVAKKNGKQRLVLDCRLTNILFAHAPTVEIGSSEAMSAIELEPGQELCAASADIEACFYQCGGIGRLSNYFCLPSAPVEVALELGLAVDVCGQEFAGRERVHPCLVVLPMGWSWSFWLVQRIHLEMLRRAAVPDDRIALGAWPLPSLTSGPVELPYSDNINVLGVRAEEVTELRDRVVARFSEEGFSMREISETSVHSTILGADVGGHPPVTRRAGQKLWLLRGALQWLASGPIVTGRQAWIFSAVAVLLGSQLDRPWSSTVTATDASATGFGRSRASLWCMLGPLSVAGRGTFAEEPLSSSGRLPVPTLGLRPKGRRLATAAVGEGLVRRPSGLELHARLAKALEPNRSSPASAMALSRCELAAAADATRVGYKAYSDAFQVFLAEEGGAPSTIEDMEVRVLQFLDLMLEAECTRADASILVAAVKDAYPWCTGSQTMPRVSRGLRGYTKRRPPASRAPLPRELLGAVVSEMLARGQRGCALQVASTFFTYVRPGALRKLQVRQLLAPSRASGQLQCWSLILAPTQMDASMPGDPRGSRRELAKTGTSDETVIIGHPAWLGECPAAHVRGRAPTDLIFPAPGAFVAAQFGVAARKCGLPRVCLYQLRRGGASGDVLSGRRDRKTVKARGHWRTDSSLNRYGKPGAVHQLLNAMTPASRDFGRQTFEVVGSLFERTVAAETIPK
ncbi:unnamed protein product [Prorocentrum cordatum]|uniref:Uncharacterized protein n=1 Tax=Prorocentrum cordatum TaxID=2364126 RepID=A0ABN9XQF0_9DINO|nr:unnamed protein product [Polarella glacialis]